MAEELEKTKELKKETPEINKKPSWKRLEEIFKKQNEEMQSMIQKLYAQELEEDLEIVRTLDESDEGTNEGTKAVTKNTSSK